LKTEFHPKNRELFEYGSIGDRFYIIIEGEISVHIPNPECRDFKRRYEEIIEERKWQKEMQEQTKMLERQVEVAEQKVKIAEEKLALYRH
jgi:CRP-like cAMP-binding protein